MLALTGGGGRWIGWKEFLKQANSEAPIKGEQEKRIGSHKIPQTSLLASPSLEEEEVKAQIQAGRLQYEALQGDGNGRGHHGVGRGLFETRVSKAA